jgi:hypothetical protein
MAQAAQQPAFRAFAVEKREGQDDFWLSIGAAFPHQDGKGFNLILQAHPIGNKIVLREPQDDNDRRAAEDEGPKERSERSRRGR